MQVLLLNPTLPCYIINDKCLTLTFQLLVLDLNKFSIWTFHFLSRENQQFLILHFNWGISVFYSNFDWCWLVPPCEKTKLFSASMAYLPNLTGRSNITFLINKHQCKLSHCQLKHHTFKATKVVDIFFNADRFKTLIANGFATHNGDINLRLNPVISS